MTFNQSAYLDVSNILIYEVIGDIWLFCIIGILLIVILSAKYQIRPPAMLMLIIIFIGVTVASTLSGGIFWLLVIIGVFGFYGYALYRYFKGV